MFFLSYKYFTAQTHFINIPMLAILNQDYNVLRDVYYHILIWFKLFCCSQSCLFLREEQICRQFGKINISVSPFGPFSCSLHAVLSSVEESQQRRPSATFNTKEQAQQKEMLTLPASWFLVVLVRSQTHRQSSFTAPAYIIRFQHKMGWLITLQYYCLRRDILLGGKQELLRL